MIKINKKSKNLGTVDLDLLLNEELSFSAKWVYTVMMNIPPSSRDMKKIYDCLSGSKSDIDNAITELLDRGFIEIVKKGVFPLWIEGYIATGQDSAASYLGEFEGRTFNEACDNWAKTLPESDRAYYHKGNEYWGYRPHLWGCNIYDNEKDARKAFG